MAEQKQKIRFRDIMNRNLLLFMAMQLILDFSTNIVSGFSNMGAKQAGITVAAIGTATSIYTAACLIVRMPAGNLTNSDKKKVFLLVLIALRWAATALTMTVGLTSGGAWMVTRGIFGLIAGSASIMIPAMAAMLMDRRALGTTLAIYTAVTAACKSFVRAAGISLYQNYGVWPALLIAAGLVVVAMVLICLMDFKDPKLNPPAKAKKGGFFSNLNLKFVPVCLVLNFVVFTWSINTSYNTVVAADRGIDIATITAICGVISSVSAFVCSAACDFINPKYVLLALFAILSGGTFLIGHAYDYNTFLIADILVTVGTGFSKIIAVYLFKNCTRAEKGSVHATNYFCTDIFSVFAGVLIGQLITNTSYETAYSALACVGVAAFLVILLFGNKLMKLEAVQEEN